MRREMPIMMRATAPPTKPKISSGLYGFDAPEDSVRASLGILMAHFVLLLTDPVALQNNCAVLKFLCLSDRSRVPQSKQVVFMIISPLILSIDGNFNLCLWIKLART